MSPRPTIRSVQSASSSRGFDKELAELEALSEALKAGAGPNSAQVEHLRKALTHRNNFLVAKAAKLVADAELFALLPDVLTAFDRFFIDAANSDPKCWAKDALSGAGQAGTSEQRCLPPRHAPSSTGGKLGPAGGFRRSAARHMRPCAGRLPRHLRRRFADGLAGTDDGFGQNCAHGSSAGHCAGGWS